MPDKKGRQLCYMPNKLYFWTNLGPIQVQLIVEHILQWCKSCILEDLTDIVILGPTVTL